MSDSCVAKKNIEEAIRRAGSSQAFAKELDISTHDVDRLLSGEVILNLSAARQCQDKFGVCPSVFSSKYLAILTTIDDEDREACFPYWQLVDIPVSQIITQPAFSKTDPGYQAVYQSLQKKGLARPIAIDHQNNLIFGAKRLAAARALGWTFLESYCLPTRRIWELDEGVDFLEENLNPYECYKFAQYLEHTFPDCPVNSLVEEMQMYTMFGEEGTAGESEQNECSVLEQARQIRIQELCRLMAPHAALEWQLIRQHGLFLLRLMAEDELLSREDAALIAKQPLAEQQRLLHLPNERALLLELNALRIKSDSAYDNVFSLF